MTPFFLVKLYRVWLLRKYGKRKKKVALVQMNLPFFLVHKFVYRTPMICEFFCQNFIAITSFILVKHILTI